MKLTETELQLIIDGLRAHLATFESNSVIGKIMKRDVNALIRRLRAAQEKS